MITINPATCPAPTYLDNSGYCTYRRCPAKYCFSRILGLQPPRPKIAADFGTAIHAAMPCVQRGEPDEACRVFSETWKAFGHEESKERNTQVGHRMLREYPLHSRHYTIVPPPEQALRPSEKWSDDEFAFAVDLGGPLIYAGRIDAVARTDSGEIIVIEYKTSAEAGARAQSSFDINPQQIGYTLAASIVLGQAVGGALVELLRVSSASSAYLRLPYTFDPHLSEIWQEDFIDAAHNITTDFRKGAFRQNFTACTSYPQYAQHGYLCDYFDLCRVSNMTPLLESFTVEHWHPFAELVERT